MKLLVHSEEAALHAAGMEGRTAEAAMMLRDSAWLSRAATLVLAQELCGGYDESAQRTAASLPLAIDLSLVTAEEIREINRRYRGICRVTDVLSFPQYEGLEAVRQALSSLPETRAERKDAGAGEAYLLPLGDVVLCPERAAEQAKAYVTGLRREICYLVVHSLLHLLGYDHESETDRRRMRAREEQVMAALGLGRA